MLKNLGKRLAALWKRVVRGLRGGGPGEEGGGR
jgi:hypothetical protein